MTVDERPRAHDLERMLARARDLRSFHLRNEAAMPWLFKFFAKWRAARRAARLNRIRQIVRKGLSAVE